MALAPQQFCVRWNSYHSNLQTVFPKLLSTENFADVTLACENRQLRCHKVVLSACSAYFERLLVQNPCKHPIIFMKDMRFSEMQSLVDFMYKGEVNVTQDDLPSLLKSAEALQIRGLCLSEAGGAEAAPAAKGTQTDDGRDFTLASEALLRAQLDCLCSSEAGGAEAAPAAKGTQTGDGRDFTLASEALLRAQLDCADGGAAARQPERANGACGKKRRAEGAPTPPPPPPPTVKEETVEEDGLFYGELDNDDIDFNEDEETDKPSGSLAQPSASQPTIRVKPESKLFLADKPKSDSDYLARLSCMNAHEIQSEFAKYGFTTGVSPEGHPSKMAAAKPDDNDYYKSWLEQNGELEVSLLRVGGLKKAEAQFLSEIELVPKTKTKSLLEKTLTTRSDGLVPSEVIKTALPQMKKFARRGRPPLFKDKYFDIGGSSLKADLDQFLEGKEVSSSGLSRKDLERVMMGKFNPNRRYSNEAMWAALMDVKKGGSIYRAAQTHKVPRKSLRNWMKRCHIKSSFPMPQQLKQFVENNKKQKTPGCPDFQGTSTGDLQEGKTPEVYSQLETGFGKHFLTFHSTLSSDEDAGLVVEEGTSKDTKVGLIEKRADCDSDAILNMSMRD